MPKPIPQVFMVIPWEPEFENVYYAIKQITAKLGGVAERADDPYRTQPITRRIFAKIRDADLVVADITLPKANVFYELGYAQAIGKTVCMIARGTDNIPFDVKDYPVISYEGHEVSVPRLIRHLEPEIERALKAAMSSVSLKQPVSDIIRCVSDLEGRDDLFSRLVEASLRDLGNRLEAWTSGTMRAGPTETITKGIEIFRKLTKGGFATYLVPIEEYWVTNRQYLEEGRLASKVRGAAITRAFILADQESLFSNSLYEHVQHDEEAGIKTFIVLSRDVTDKEAVRDFGIWDDEVLCLIDVTTVGGRPTPTGCMFTRSPTELNTARVWRDSLLSVAKPALPLLERLRNQAPVDQLLLRSADRMERLAKQLCKGGYIDGGGCDWYHSAWQYLRILDMVSTPDWHAGFFHHALHKAVVEEGCRRILICGTADYAMLHHVAEAVPSDILEDMRIVVLDTCPTPLQICKWFADQRGISVRIIEQDALNMELRAESFDVVVTDAFLTRFTAEERVQLLSEWRRMLCPEGTVITTARMSIETGEERVIGSPSDIAYFVDSARQRIKERKSWLAPSTEHIIELAKEYAEHIVSYPIESEDYLRNLFEGFDVSIAYGDTPGEFRGRTVYAHIVARKTNSQKPGW